MRKLHKRNVIMIIAVIILLAAAITTVILITRHNTKDTPTLSEVVDDKFSAYETDFIDSLGSMTSNDAVADYLLHWGKNKEISAAKDLNGNIIFSIDATGGFEDADPVAVVCGYDSDNMSDYIESIAAALTISKNSKNHGEYKVIFCPESNGKKIGVSSISQSYFTDDTKLFYLGKSYKNTISSSTGGYRLFRLSDKLEYDTPDGDKAYKISIENIPSGIAEIQDDSIPNPIKILGSLLANLKTTSVIFEISDISGGDIPDMNPSFASMTLVINSSDFSKFKSKVKSSIETFNDKYSSDYPQIQYTYEETDLPSKVLTEDKTDNIVSLLYTSLCGVYNRDNSGHIVALTNIGNISTDDDRLTIEVTAMSHSEEYLREMVESYQTISGLCSVDFDSTLEYDIFDGGGNSQELAANFKDAFKDFSGDNIKSEDTAVFTSCTFLASKNPNMAILYCGITEKNKREITGSIITFLNKEDNNQE